MLIHAASRPADDMTATPHEWTVEAEDYAQAMAEVSAAVPEGWVLLRVGVDH